MLDLSLPGYCGRSNVTVMSHCQVHHSSCQELSHKCKPSWSLVAARVIMVELQQLPCPVYSLVIARSPRGVLGGSVTFHRSVFADEPNDVKVAWSSI